MKIKGCEIKVEKADLTSLRVDAIVNAANNELVMGGGLAGAIRKRGGKQIEDEAVKIGPIAVGGAVATGAGNLAAKFVIHAATMGMDFKTDETKVRNSCRNALKVAGELGVSSIAFPALGCGVGKFPLLAAAKIMAQEVFRHLRDGKSNLRQVIFCLYDEEAFAAFQKGVIGYLEHVTEVLGYGPFITVDAIIELGGSIVVIERSNPPFGWALPGGFVDYGESLEDAVRREMREETGLELLSLKQFHTYSRPGRDPRFHTITTVFIAQANGKPQAGDDAKGLKLVRLSQIAEMDFAFDHKSVIEDYINFKQGKSPF
jgi:O-acetyl-ADP-ribose deacetylase (regulator of RNase III)/ADP-ribose pyrophosphatase YjhB (NUDIX family)